MSRLGNWIEKHFPEKMTTEEVNKMFEKHEYLLKLHESSIQNFSNSLANIQHLQESVSKLTDELSVLKNQSVAKSRIMSGNPIAINPFASTLTSGVNK